MVRSKNGFTLPKLLVVLVIISVLAAIAIPNFIALHNRSYEGSTKANMHTIQLAIEDYGVRNNGMYPGSSDALRREAAEHEYPINIRNPFTAQPDTVEFRTGEPKLDDTFPKGQVIVYVQGGGANYMVFGGNKDSESFGLVLTSEQ